MFRPDAGAKPLRFHHGGREDREGGGRGLWRDGRDIPRVRDCPRDRTRARKRCGRMRPTSTVCGSAMHAGTRGSGRDARGLPVAGAPWRRLPVAPTPNTRGRLVCAKSSAVYHRQVALPSPCNRRGVLVCQADQTGPVKLSGRPTESVDETNKDPQIQATLLRPTGWLEKSSQGQCSRTSTWTTAASG